MVGDARNAVPLPTPCPDPRERLFLRRELLVDGRTAFDNNLIRKIQRQRAERADLRPALKDAVRAHIAVPAAVEQNVPVRALDEIGRNRQPEPDFLSSTPDALSAL